MLSRAVLVGTYRSLARRILHFWLTARTSPNRTMERLALAVLLVQTNTDHVQQSCKIKGHDEVVVEHVSILLERPSAVKLYCNAYGLKAGAHAGLIAQTPEKRLTFGMHLEVVHEHDPTVPLTVTAIRMMITIGGCQETERLVSSVHSDGFDPFQHTHFMDHPLDRIILRKEEDTRWSGVPVTLSHLFPTSPLPARNTS